MWYSAKLQYALVAVALACGVYGVSSPYWISVNKNDVQCLCDTALENDCCSFYAPGEKSLDVGPFYGLASLSGACVTPNGKRFEFNSESSVCQITDFENEDDACFMRSSAIAEYLVPTNVHATLAVFLLGLYFVSLLALKSRKIKTLLLVYATGCFAIATLLPTFLVAYALKDSPEEATLNHGWGIGAVTPSVLLIVAAVGDYSTTV